MIFICFLIRCISCFGSGYRSESITSSYGSISGSGSCKKFRILTDPDPTKSFGSLRIRIHNTGAMNLSTGMLQVLMIQNYPPPPKPSTEIQSIHWTSHLSIGFNSGSHLPESIVSGPNFSKGYRFGSGSYLYFKLSWSGSGSLPKHLL
jgi:hypothetical protein